MITKTRPGREPSQYIDDTLTAMAHAHRRSVLKILHQSPEDRLAVEALVERVVDDMSNRHRPTRTSHDPEALKLKLHHCHLPKLDRCHLLNYHMDEQVIEETMSDVETDLLLMIERQC